MKKKKKKPASACVDRGLRLLSVEVQPSKAVCILRERHRHEL